MGPRLFRNSYSSLWQRLAMPELPANLDSRQIVAMVSEDLTCLLNAIVSNDGAHPEVAKSVLAYGFPCLTGRSYSSATIKQIKTWIERSIARFEPRIIPESLVVANCADPYQRVQNIVYQISGLVKAYPVPIELQLKTCLDLDSGRFSVSGASLSV